MKAKKNVSYFPVSAAEQAILLRVREADFVDRADDLLAMLDQLAEARLTPADLDQAVQLLAESRQGEGLEVRFDNLEARLKERIERGLAEIEGRLSKRLGGGAETVEPTPMPVPEVELPADPPKTPEDSGGVPKEASVAFRVGSDLVWGESAAQFYVAVWRWLFEHGRAKPSDLPIQGGKKRYVVATEPVHPSGKDFTRSEQPVPGVFVEVNLSRGDIIRRAKKYLGQFGVAFEAVVGSES
jgi:hypothetical protein